MMPRISKEQDYFERQNEILDSAQRLIYSKGYESMTIQDLLDDLKISKGAFYHYFSSKHALLEELIDRSMDQATRLVHPILEDSNLTSLEKLARYFDTVSSWKIAQKEYLIQLLKVWYKDENSLIRQKMMAAGVEFLSQDLMKLISQGVDEGAMRVDDPRMTAKVVYSLMINLGEELGGLILTMEDPQDRPSRQECFHLLKRSNSAFTQAIERVLGVRKDTIVLVSDPVLEEWIP
jgi:AcrR family transcriptional regulator